MNNVATIENVLQSHLKSGIYRSIIVDIATKMPELTHKKSTSHSNPRVLADVF